VTMQIGSHARVGWGLWLRWVGANTVAIGLAVVGIDGVARPIVDASVSSLVLRRVLVVLSIAMIGALLGGAQWLSLRGYLGRRAWWGMVTPSRSGRERAWSRSPILRASAS
jgi:hypothetical protein